MITDQKSVQYIQRWLEWQHIFGVDCMLSETSISHFEALTSHKMVLSDLKNALARGGESVSSVRLVEVSHGQMLGEGAVVVGQSFYHSASDSSSQYRDTPYSAKKTAPAVVIPITRAVLKQQDQDSQGIKNVRSVEEINACQSIEDLEMMLRTSSGCDLVYTSKHTVFASGNPKASVMLIGEAPGVEEDQEGVPFVGKSGDLLNSILQSIGLMRDDVYITNVVPWRPPGNRPPSTKELEYCMPFLRKHVELIQPKCVVLLGGTATKVLLNLDDGILKLRGHIFECHKNVTVSMKAKSLTADDHVTMKSRVEAALTGRDDNCILAIPTLHPSYIMRSPGQKQSVWRDMLLLKKILMNLV